MSRELANKPFRRFILNTFHGIYFSLVKVTLRFIFEPQSLQLTQEYSSAVLTLTLLCSTSWTSRGCRRPAPGAAARATRRRPAARAATRSPAAVRPTRPCDSTAWAGAARATRAGPGSASSCFKNNVLKQLVANVGWASGERAYDCETKVSLCSYYNCYRNVTFTCASPLRAYTIVQLKVLSML